jgi:hypothetical protein
MNITVFSAMGALRAIVAGAPMVEVALAQNCAIR